MTPKRLALVFVAVVAAAVGLALAAQGQGNGLEQARRAVAPAATPINNSQPGNRQGQSAQALSNEDCAACHEDVAKAFDRTPHAVLEKSPRHALKNSCESCHGPGEAHVTGGGDKSKIIAFKSKDSKAYNAQCLACHRKTHELTAFASGAHARSGLSCADCHKVHGTSQSTRLLKDAPNRLCQSCHVETRADFGKAFHHRVPENAMRCIDCHQPHGGQERKQLRASFTGDTGCVKCHSEKSGPFVFEHASLRVRDCQACHQPHGSNNPKMLVRATVRSLCLECHSRSQTTALALQPPSFHDVRSPRYQNCTTCHSRIHGSNADRLFLR
jgi:DmsE family decaheme c-type cytochrome